VTTVGWERPEALFGEGVGRIVLYPDEYLWWYRIQTTLVLTTGTMLLMWLGEQITERGIGNGVSLVITIGIVARLPQAAQGLRDMFFSGGEGVDAKYKVCHAKALVLLLVGVVAGVIAVTQDQRKIPVQYAQRAGPKVYSGGTSFLP
jgi:preprotein translocase subunit SecY